MAYCFSMPPSKQQHHYLGPTQAVTLFLQIPKHYSSPRSHSLFIVTFTSFRYILQANDDGPRPSSASMDNMPPSPGKPANVTEEKDEAGSGQTATMPLGGHVIVETPEGNKADLGGLGILS